MICKNLLWFPLVFLASNMLCFAQAQSSKYDTGKWVITENSSLCVNGSTNINSFACEIPSSDQSDTITISRGKTDKALRLSGQIGLKVQSFDCHNSIMTHDLRTTLKEKEFPRLYIHFLSLNELPELSVKPQAITGWVSIELAGITKKFEISYQISIDAQKTIHLLGTQSLNFSDFNIKPPRKLGGMIKTRDKLDVTFHLRIKAIGA